MTSAAPDLSLVVLSWNTKQYLHDCLTAIEAGRGQLRVEVIVIDNASEDGSADMVAAEFPQARLERNAENRGYAQGVNQGLALATGKRLGLLGSDTRVTPEALPTLVNFLDAHPSAGCVAPRLVHADGEVQGTCMRWPKKRTVLVWDTPLGATSFGKRELRRYEMKDWDHRGTRVVDQPPGTCLIVPRSVYEQIGPMDPELWLFYNDVDWVLRMKQAGFEAWYVDEAEVFHHLGASTGKFQDFAPEWHRNRIRYYRKHHGWLGTLLTKSAMLFVAARQCWRLRRELEDRQEWRQHARQLMGLAWKTARET